MLYFADSPLTFRPRRSILKRWPDFQGYGFNLHAEKGKPGQYIGKVDDDSPSSTAGLKEGDRIIEVNDVNIAEENHHQVVERIKMHANTVTMLVVDKETDEYFAQRGTVVRGDMPEVLTGESPDRHTEGKRGKPGGGSNTWVCRWWITSLSFSTLCWTRLTRNSVIDFLD